MTAEEIAATFADHENRLKVSEHRIDDLETKTDRIESLTLSVQKLAMSVEQMAREQVDYRNKQNEIAERLLTVEQKPFKDKASFHDKYTGQILTLVIGALVGYLLKSLLGI